MADRAGFDVFCHAAHADHPLPEWLEAFRKHGPGIENIITCFGRGDYGLHAENCLRRNMNEF